jgi:tetratricopeptide (TPR) repeat protein
MLALDNLGQAFAAQGQHAAARRLFEEEYARALAVQDRVCRANGAAGLGWIAAQQGDNAAATAHLENAQELLRGSYSKSTLAAVLNLIGEVVQHQGKLERAGGSYGESLILTQEVGDKAVRRIYCTRLEHWRMSKGRISMPRACWRSPNCSARPAAG